jgi:hypothetical protein
MDSQAQRENTMTVEKVSYTAKNRITGGWKNILMNHPLLHVVCVFFAGRAGNSNCSPGPSKRPLQFPECLENSGHFRLVRTIRWFFPSRPKAGL